MRKRACITLAYLVAAIVTLLAACGTASTGSDALGEQVDVYPLPTEMIRVAGYPAATATVISTPSPVPAQVLAACNEHVGLSAEPARTPIPTWTAAPPDFVLPTATNFPSPTPDESLAERAQLVLIAIEQQGEAPLTTTLCAVVLGGPDDSYELHCPSVAWEFGDGTSAQMIAMCEAWIPNIPLSRVSTIEHTYTAAGTYAAQVRVGPLSSNTNTIEVR